MSVIPLTELLSTGDHFIRIPETRADRLEVRLAESTAELAAAQALRYAVFYDEMGAIPSPAMKAARRDFDQFDSVCDHLLVIDHGLAPDEAVVGTYRLLRQEVAEKHGGFYSASEYDISILLARATKDQRILELGRSCVHPAYRTNLTIQLLWRGISGYIFAHRIAYMIGCASLPGTDPERHALALSYLYHEFLAPEDIRVRALPERFVEMNRIPRDKLPLRQALRGLPPLVKGYLRLGAFVGDGAVVDPQFRTTDCFILLPVARLSERYMDRLDRE